ncbi:adenine phosphoribosyltransferase [Acidiferrimicrobium sp. IK]|uniref:adenine phosphoribosyltransferase n=1 Tax=Acidiferrimicrobium sp. IK TaxID=2871700 RepID=UPI0021CB002F|nr:adenine phosphoribosyltransferase [Acidiferrimicrobium sp. IK]MCU4184847.1 adenine phosphoribosyltransferase [Acidiferrimicrobium sp. IK]
MEPAPSALDTAGAAVGGSEWIKDHIRDIPDFPKPGVVYKDITPLLSDPRAFAGTVDALAAGVPGGRIDKVVGIEARGFILAAPVALRLGAGFVPVRKTGKLPGAVTSQSYELEYRSDVLEIHTDALEIGERVLIVDDVLATGGTAVATAALIRSLGAEVVGVACVIELAFLGGRGKLGDLDAVALISY